MSNAAGTVRGATISMEAMEVLRAIRSPADGPLSDSRAYPPGRRISTTVESHAIKLGPASRRSVDASFGRRVSLSQALVAVSSQSQSSSFREALSTTRFTDDVSNQSSSEAALVPTPPRTARESLAVAATSPSSSPQGATHTRPPTGELPLPAPTLHESSETPAPPGAGPSFAQKFKRRVDALGTLNENGAGLTVRSDAHAVSPTPTEVEGAGPIPSREAATFQRAPEVSQKTAMQLFFDAEDDRSTVQQRPGDFRRRVNVTNPAQWHTSDTSSDSSDTDDI